jgi:hypothetical protein
LVFPLGAPRHLSRITLQTGLSQVSHDCSERCQRRSLHAGLDERESAEEVGELGFGQAVAVGDAGIDLGSEFGAAFGGALAVGAVLLLQHC